MKQLLCLTALVAVAAARPELYKETEDFQYARSSSDQGTKSGYYGARRGNMGGNYEKAHNMDHLAQNQMSGLVRQVDGEVGEAAKLRAGHVFADASSRGIYGSGNYDTSNLHGRNFQEGVREGSFADTHSALASHNSGYVAGQAAQHSSGYNSHSASSRYTGYQGTKSAQALNSANLQATEDVAGAYGRETGYSAGHSSQYEYQGSHNSDYAVVPSNRLISTMPVRVSVRPGGRVAVPVGVQTYDSTHSASTMDHNTINTEAEVLAVPDHVVYKPSNNAKYYETSSSYKKHWEKHDTRPEVIPLAIPTENPFPVNSELYDDTHALHTSALASHNAIKSNVYSGYNANVNAASSQSRYESAHDAQRLASLNSNAHGAYVGGVADMTNGLDSTPTSKSHQSSYSYHKSWERQGDPYVITPVGGVGTASQRLTSASANQEYAASHQYGAHTKSSQQRYYQANGVDCDCDENGQVRVARSADHGQQRQAYEDLQQQQENKWEDLTQQAQTGWNNQRQLASDNLKELGQQTQNEWDDLTQKAQTGWNHQSQSNSEKLEDLGQQTQKQWGDLTQQVQTGWKREGHIASEKFEDLGQQTHKQWGDLTQQAQTGWDRQRNRASEKLENFGQESQNQGDDLTQQAQTSWGDKHRRAEQTLEDFGQQAQTAMGKRAQPQVTWNREEASFYNPENLNYMVQKPQKPWYSEDLEHEAKTIPELNAGRHHDSDYNEQQIQTHTGFKPLNSYNKEKKYSQNSLTNEPYHINPQHSSEGIHSDPQHDNWQIFQAQYDDEDLTQQTHPAWDGFFHYSNINKDVSSDKQVKPMELGSEWEQSETKDDSQQIVQNPLDGIYTRPNSWSSTYETQQNTNETDKTQQTWQTNAYGGSWKQHNISGRNNYSTQQPQHGSSLQSLWKKIDNFDQTSTTNLYDKKKQNSSISWQGQSTSQVTYGSSMEHGYEGNAPSQQTFYQNGANGYNHWIPMIGDPGIINTAPTNIVTPKDRTQTSNIRPVESMDVGRGDIGSEDSIKTTTTEKVFVSGYSQGYPIFTENKREKTPEEIEALSLTIPLDTANKSSVYNASNLQNQESQETLKVLSLDQQKWLEEHHHDSTYMSNSNRTINSSTERKIIGTLNATDQYTGKDNIHDTQRSESGRSFNNQNGQGRVTGSNFYTNKPVHRGLVTPAFDSEHKPYTNQQHSSDKTDQNLQQHSEGGERTGNFEQQSQGAWEAHFEEGQENYNFDQQNQAAWGQDLADLGQQEQTAWKAEDIQEQNNQQLEKLGRSNTDQYQTRDFYNQRYHTNGTGSNKTEQLRVTPEMETEKRVTNLQSVVPDDRVLLAPMEPTEKPGFWKSVSRKLTSAKDKVSSWFKQS